MTGAGANGEQFVESELLAQVLAELSEPLLSRGSGWSMTTHATSTPAHAGISRVLAMGTGGRCWRGWVLAVRSANSHRYHQHTWGCLGAVSVC